MTSLSFHSKKVEWKLKQTICRLNYIFIILFWKIRMESKTKTRDPWATNSLTWVKATADLQMLYNIFFNPVIARNLKDHHLSGDLNAFCVPYVNLRGQELPPGDHWSVSMNAPYHHEQKYIWFRGGDLNGFWDIKPYMNWRDVHTPRGPLFKREVK